LLGVQGQRRPESGWEDVAATGRLVEPDLDFPALQEASDRSDLRLRVDEVRSVTRHEFLDDAAQRPGGKLVRGNPDAWLRFHSRAPPGRMPGRYLVATQEFARLVAPCNRHLDVECELLEWIDVSRLVQGMA
jgi:hypothetical protein